MMTDLQVLLEEPIEEKVEQEEPEDYSEFTKNLNDLLTRMFPGVDLPACLDFTVDEFGWHGCTFGVGDNTTVRVYEDYRNYYPRLHFNFGQGCRADFRYGEYYEEGCAEQFKQTYQLSQELAQRETRKVNSLLRAPLFEVVMGLHQFVSRESVLTFNVTPGGTQVRLVGIDGHVLIWYFDWTSAVSLLAAIRDLSPWTSEMWALNVGSYARDTYVFSDSSTGIWFTLHQDGATRTKLLEFCTKLLTYYESLDAWVQAFMVEFDVEEMQAWKFYQEHCGD